MRSDDEPETEDAPSPRARLFDRLKPLGCLLLPVVFIAPIVVLGAAISLITGLAFGPWALLARMQGDAPLLVAVGLTAVVFHFASVHVYAHQVDALMRRRVGEPVPERDRGPVDAPPAEPDPAGVVGSSVVRGRLSFQTHGASSEELIDTPAEYFVRDRLQNRRGRAFLTGVLVALAVSFLLQLILIALQPGEYGTSIGAPSDAGAASDVGALDGAVPAERVPPEFWWLRAIVRLLTPYSVAGVVVWLMYRHRLGIGIPTALFAGVAANAIWIVVALAIRYGETSGEAPALGLVLMPLTGYLATVLISAVLALRHGRGQASEWLLGRRLLVLRVFGVDRNTGSLFGQIGRRWPFLGPVVTIVDPSYARFTFNQARYFLLLILALPPLLMTALINDLSATGSIFQMVVVYYVAYLPLMLGVMLWHLHMRSGRNLRALARRLEFKSTGLFKDRYPSIRLACFDDLWRSTMAHLVQWADVVLMDLRGFDADRKGCEYELAHLIDHCPLGRTAFLTDETTDMDLFRATMRAEWEALEPNSPNAGRAEVVVHNYAATATGKALRREMRPMLALLGELTTSEAAGPSPARRRSEARDDEAEPLTRAIARGIYVSWGLIALGIVLLVVLRFGFGFSVTWLGGIGLMLSTRMRNELMRHGTLPKRFAKGPWGIAFFFVVAGWLVFGLLIPLGTVAG